MGGGAKAHAQERTLKDGRERFDGKLTGNCHYALPLPPFPMKCNISLVD